MKFWEHPLWPNWPSQDISDIQESVEALIGTGFFDQWPPSREVSFWLHGLMGHKPSDIAFDSFIGCQEFPETTLNVIREFYIHECDLEVVWADIPRFLRANLGHVICTCACYCLVISHVREF